jgi:NitT/TauT family transport system ATP-binding protein
LRRGNKLPELRIDRLSRTFVNGKDRYCVLNELSFAVEKNQFVSIVGPSGCGKTTLLNIIAGFLKPTSGDVIVGDKAVSDPGPDRAFVFQSYALFPWMTVRDNIIYPMKLQRIDVTEREKQLKHLLSLVHMEEKGGMFPQQLSGGMKQRIGVIRALACRPRILLMDEPLGAVDMHMRRKLQEDMEDIFFRDRITVIMVTHDVDEAVFLSDRIIVLAENGGRIKSDIRVDLERPRNRREPRYQELVNSLSDVLEHPNDEKNRPKKEDIDCEREGLISGPGDYHCCC